MAAAKRETGASMEYSDFIIFADESGDVGVKSIDPQYPVFVFSCCVFRRQEYCRATLPAIARLKLNYFGNQDIILRSRNIRIGQPPFDFPYDRQRRSAFMRDLSQVIDDANFTIIAAVIDKPKLLRQRPNPTPLDRQAFRLCVNRIYNFIADRGPDNLRIPFIIESRGQKENDTLQQEFWSIQSRRVATNRKLLNLEIEFDDKKNNNPGVQIADLVATPIGSRVANPHQTGQVWPIIAPKLYRGPGGAVDGWGLTVFPAV